MTVEKGVNIFGLYDQLIYFLSIFRLLHEHERQCSRVYTSITRIIIHFNDSIICFFFPVSNEECSRQQHLKGKTACK